MAEFNKISVGINGPPMRKFHVNLHHEVSISNFLKPKLPYVQTEFIH